MKNKLKTEMYVVYHFLQKPPVEKKIKDLSAIKIPKGCYGYGTFTIDRFIHEETNREMFSDPYDVSKMKIFGKVYSRADVKKVLKEISGESFAEMFDENYLDIKKFVRPTLAEQKLGFESMFLPYEADKMDVVEHTLDNPVK